MVVSALSSTCYSNAAKSISAAMRLAVSTPGVTCVHMRAGVQRFLIAAVAYL